MMNFQFSIFNFQEIFNNLIFNENWGIDHSLKTGNCELLIATEGSCR